MELLLLYIAIFINSVTIMNWSGSLCSSQSAPNKKRTKLLEYTLNNCRLYSGVYSNNFMRFFFGADWELHSQPDQFLVARAACGLSKILTRYAG